ncbi:MAG: SDR family NAD(P)-dependent oxidoreductase [Ignavibacteriales bacterium]|nr:SDR family NAD(P)-dependent oxidoreductase [Ignavibacteriales bacterium]
MDLGLKGKVAVVSAASEGLGKASALALAEEGADLVICSRRKKEIADAADEIRSKTKARIETVVADVANPDDIKNLVGEAKKRFGTVHVLVNNAGGPPTGSIQDMPDAEWEKGFNLTMMSMVRMTREVLPMMVQQKWGRIITITSFVAKQPLNELLLSVSLRPGIHGLTKILSNQYARYNVTVNTVCPGNILTKRQEELNRGRAVQKNMTLEEYLADAAKQIPAERIGRPD